MMPRFRIGCVPFLNARPLIAYFETQEGKGEADVIYAAPSMLAEMVLSKQVDVALASSFFALQFPELKIAPGASISSVGAVDSVRLFSKVPYGDIRTLALDASSATSNNLAQMLLSERYGVTPQCAHFAPNLSRMISECDAAVLIGDAGMSAEATGLRVLDLGAAWDEMAGLPFVWALWLGRQDLDADLVKLLATAKGYGMSRLREISESEAARLGWPVARCYRYLAEVIDYELSPKHMEGFSLFASKCAEMGFVPRPATVLTPSDAS